MAESVNKMFDLIDDLSTLCDDGIPIFPGRMIVNTRELYKIVNAFPNAISDEIQEYNNKLSGKENPESVFIQKQRQKRIVKAINSLKPKLKEVVMMYEIDGLNYEYIAKELNCPIGTVKSRLFNAKKELAILLEDLL